MCGLNVFYSHSICGHYTFRYSVPFWCLPNLGTNSQTLFHLYAPYTAVARAQRGRRLCAGPPPHTPHNSPTHTAPSPTPHPTQPPPHTHTPSGRQVPWVGGMGGPVWTHLPTITALQPPSLVTTPVACLHQHSLPHTPTHTHPHTHTCCSLPPPRLLPAFSHLPLFCTYAPAARTATLHLLFIYPGALRHCACALAPAGIGLPCSLPVEVSTAAIPYLGHRAASLYHLLRAPRANTAAGAHHGTALSNTTACCLTRPALHLPAVFHCFSAPAASHTHYTHHTHSSFCLVSLKYSRSLGFVGTNKHFQWFA